MSTHFDQTIAYRNLVDLWLKQQWTAKQHELLRRLIYLAAWYGNPFTMSRRQICSVLRKSDGTVVDGKLTIAKSTFWDKAKELQRLGLIAIEGNGTQRDKAHDEFFVDLDTIDALIELIKVKEESSMARKTGVQKRRELTGSENHTTQSENRTVRRDQVRDQVREETKDTCSPPEDGERGVLEAIQSGRQRAIDGRTTRATKKTETGAPTEQALKATWQNIASNHGCRPGDVTGKDYGIWRKHWKKLERQDYKEIFGWAFHNWAGTIKLTFHSQLSRSAPWREKPYFKMLAYNWSEVVDLFDGSTDRALEQVLPEERFTVQENRRRRIQRHRERTSAPVGEDDFGEMILNNPRWKKDVH